MGLKIPSNKISTNYTPGNDYIIKSSYANYQGYYYELNGNFYTGKEYTSTAQELLPVNSSKVNKLLRNSNTVVYGAVSKIIMPDNKEPQSYFFDNDTTNITRYFIKRMNTNIIKEIDNNTYVSYQNNPSYVSVSLYYPFNEIELNKAESKIPGIKTFIQTTYTPGVTD